MIILYEAACRTHNRVMDYDDAAGSGSPDDLEDGKSKIWNYQN